MKKIVPILLCILSGLLLFLAFPPFSFSFFSWIALIPLFAVLWRGEKPKGIKALLKKGLYGYIFGVFFFGSSFWWINEVSTLGYFPLTLYLSIFPALWSILAGGILRPKRPPYPGLDPDTKITKAIIKKWSYNDMFVTFLSALSCAAAWVVMEWLRGYGEISFQWNTIGVSLPVSLTQSAEYIGAIGLSFLPVFINAILWSVGSRLTVGLLHSGRRSAQWDFLVGVSAIALLFLWGTWRIVSVNNVKGTTPLSVLIIQENIPQEEKWKPEKKGDHYQNHLNSTVEAIDRLEKQFLENMSTDGVTRLLRPNWVIWPESAIPWSLQHVEGPPIQELENQPVNQIENLVWKPYSEERGPFTLIAGLNEIFYKDPAKGGQLDKVYNSMIAFSPDNSAKKRQIYHKKHLVAFGEFIPFRKTFSFLEDAFTYSYGSPMGANMSRGKSNVPLKIVTGKQEIQVIPTICFEDSVARHLRPFVRTEKPQVIINITNDGWFNHSWANEQHFANARLRSIELRRPLIRAANTGISAIVGADGYTFDYHYPEEGIRELRDENGSPFLKGTLFGTVDLPLEPELTLYAQWGDWFVIWCFLFVLFLSLLPFIRRSQSKNGIKDGVYTPLRKQEENK